MAEPDRRDPDAAARPSARRWAVPAAIIAVTALLVAGVFWTQQEEEPAPAPAQSTAPTAPVGQRGIIEHPDTVAKPDLSAQEGRDPGDLLAEGPADAPVVLVMFTDYQCPYCATWSEETLPVLREYVERGRLRIEFRDVNIYGEDSERAARASLAAAMQGAHAEYHAALFEDGEIRSAEGLSREALIALAGELGLDTEQFTQDLDSQEVRETIAANAQQGVDLGAFSTPSFVIGGEPTVGAQPTAEFTAMVEEALAEAGAGSTD